MPLPGSAAASLQRGVGNSRVGLRALLLCAPTVHVHLLKLFATPFADGSASISPSIHYSSSVVIRGAAVARWKMDLSDSSIARCLSMFFESFSSAVSCGKGFPAMP